MSTSSRSKPALAEMSSGTLLCTSIVGRTVEDLAAKAATAVSAGTDLVEFRFDSLGHPEAGQVDTLAPFLGRSIFTVRSSEEGGSFPGSEAQRLELILRLAEAKPAYVDVELSALKKNPSLQRALPKSKTIVSWHDTEKTPPEERLRAVLREAESYGGIPKVVTTAREPADNLRVLSLYDEARPPPVAFCMGEIGFLSRVVAMERRSPLTYASLPGEEAAPGQPSLPLMIAIRRLGSHA